MLSTFGGIVPNGSPQTLTPPIEIDFALQAIGLPQYFPTSPYQIQNLGLGNSGVKIVIQFLDENGNPLDVSKATKLTITIAQPDGSIQSAPAAFYTNGTDGKIAWVSGPSDLQDAGLYFVQGSVLRGTAALVTYTGPLQVGSSQFN